MSKKEILGKLQEPFDESLGTQYVSMDGELMVSFGDPVLIQRLNEVLGLDWSSRKVSGGIEITFEIGGTDLTCPPRTGPGIMLVFGP